MLIGAKLRKADFTGALLQRAELIKSDLRGARFECAVTNILPPQQCAQLQGASLKGAQLEDASLDGAQLQGASLRDASLQGASLRDASLQGASLDRAQLQGARLDHARLQGASLSIAKLQGASFYHALLQGARLDEAQLQGASFYDAQLQGVWFQYAQLQGASFHDALLQGARLDHARLQGASLQRVLVWRADARKAFWKDTRVANAETGQKIQCRWASHPLSDCDWSAKSFDKLKRLITDQVPEGNSRRKALERIQTLDPAETLKEDEMAMVTLKGEDEMAKVWKAQARSSPGKEVYEKRVAGIWRETGCAAEGAPYVLRGLLDRLVGQYSPFGDQSPQPSVLAAAFLDEEHCPGAHGLTDVEKAKLNAIRDRSPPPVPKQ